MDFSGLMLLIYVTWFGMLAAVGVPLPVSVPPLPEDPVLVRMAPADCLAFCSWSGAAEPDPKSPNRTERLCAEHRGPAVDRAAAGGARRPDRR